MSSSPLSRRAGALGLLAAGTMFFAAAASAATPRHTKESFGPFAIDVPAGALCDFPYHAEEAFTRNKTSFFDDSGNLVRVEDQVDLHVLHRNAQTGQTLTEQDDYAAHVDLVSGEAAVTGQSWHLRDENGRLVVAGAGLFTVDILTGEVLTGTPNVKTDGRATVCPALGGAPAA